MPGTEADHRGDEIVAPTHTTFRIWRGEAAGGQFRDYPTEVSDGMVVLDAIHKIQAEQANDLAVRWNCKAGKCGSCSAEVNGSPRLMCMTRLNQLDLAKPVTVEPMRAFPPVRDLVTDVSFNYRAKAGIRRFKPRPPDADDGTWRMQQVDVERVQEFRNASSASSAGRLSRAARPSMFDDFVGPRHMVMRRRSRYSRSMSRIA
jgi:succinate dehydrogenase / fumarate reductase iron-sulfur subunit